MVARTKERLDASIRSVSMSSTLKKTACEVVERAGSGAFSIATAESCTAGALATLLADTPGAGTCFLGGFVTYAKACKTQLLGIPRALIQVHTAVSREVAEEMAKGALAASGADIAIAVTGVLGPEPDEDGNPVGLIHLAAAARGGALHHIEVQSQDTSRGDNRHRALSEALRLLDQVLRQITANPTPAPP